VGSASTVTVICLDFDGVLHDSAHPIPHRRMGPPISGALEGVQALQRAGHRLIIHSARCHDDARVDHVYSWLHYFGFGHIDVSLTKPMADVYLDDKAVRFTSWDQLHHQHEWYNALNAKKPGSSP
jgi:hypothetical protein